MEDQVLENIYVDVEVADDEFEVQNTIPIKSLPYNAPASTYIIVKLPEEVSLLTTSFSNTLRFVVKDADVAGPSDLGITDEYAVSHSRMSIKLLCGI